MRGGSGLCGSPPNPAVFLCGLPGCEDDVWLRGDLELLKRCDAIWMIDGWTDSSGATGEWDYAVQMGITVLLSNQDVMDYLMGPK